MGRKGTTETQEEQSGGGRPNNDNKLKEEKRLKIKFVESRSLREDP